MVEKRVMADPARVEEDNNVGEVSGVFSGMRDVEAKLVALSASTGKQRRRLATTRSRRRRVASRGGQLRKWGRGERAAGESRKRRRDTGRGGFTRGPREWRARRRRRSAGDGEDNPHAAPLARGDVQADWQQV